MLSRIIDGVLVVQHGASRRAFAPSLRQRVLLIWIFRYFGSLPSTVLTGWQRKLISEVVNTASCAPLPLRGSGVIIGTVESPVVSPASGQPLPHGKDWEYVG
jgi:hypothetical protein